MIAYAAIDLRHGRVVQLVGGDPQQQRVELPDPAAVARQWIAHGFAALHVVDLDAALEQGSNGDAVESVLRAADGVSVQVGGGVRSTDRVAELLDAGAEAVVAGTRAVCDPDWLEQVCARWPDRIIAAADVRDGAVVVRGWTETAGVSAADLLARLAALPLRAVLVTDVGREGRLAGADARGFRRLAALSARPLIASGGVAGADDLEALDRAGVAGVVLGMALYTGSLDPGEVARKYRT